MKKKINPYKVFTFGIIGLLLVGIVIATTTITNQGASFGGDITLPTDRGIYLSATDCDDSGELCNNINLRAIKPESKPFIGWYDYTNSLVGWMGCHYNSTTGNIHQHCSIETRNSTGTIKTRFDIPYGLPDSETRVGIKEVESLKLYTNVFLRMNNASVFGVGQIKFFPNNQNTKALTISNGSTSIILSATDANNILISGDNLTISELAGSGQAFLCVDSNGKLIRSATICVE
jgi:hypothetical protein